MLETKGALPAVNMSGDFQRSVPLPSRRDWADVLRQTERRSRDFPSSSAIAGLNLVLCFVVVSRIALMPTSPTNQAGCLMCSCSCKGETADNCSVSNQVPQRGTRSTEGRLYVVAEQRFAADSGECNHAPSRLKSSVRRGHIDENRIDKTIPIAYVMTYLLEMSR